MDSNHFAKSNKNDRAIVFSAVLREAMERSDISVSTLAHKSGVPTKTIYHWLSGQEPRKIVSVCSIARVLNMTLEEIFFGASESNRQNQFELPAHVASSIEIKGNEIVLRIHLSGSVEKQR